VIVIPSERSESRNLAAGSTTARRSARRAFTLVEVLVCCTLIVVGFTALLAALGQDSRASLAGDQITTGTYLADEIRDMALQMTLANVLALNGTTFNPAQLSTGTAFSPSGWTQTIAVAGMLAGDLNHAGATAARITVTVSYNNMVVATQTYYQVP
jgi:Tfp pilus assembly protein PilV